MNEINPTSIPTLGHERKVDFKKLKKLADMVGKTLKKRDIEFLTGKS